MNFDSKVAKGSGLGELSVAPSCSLTGKESQWDAVVLPLGTAVSMPSPGGEA